MASGDLEVGEFCLSTNPVVLSGAWLVRAEGRVVDGTAEIHRVTGPHEIEMEIHYIKVESGQKWVVAGEAFNGPKWIFGQLSGRLRISVIEKSQGHVFDLTIPSPGKRNKGVYTSSMSTDAQLSAVYPEMFELLHQYGAKEIGTRESTIGDKSNRKGFTNVILEAPDSITPVIGFFLTRLVALTMEYERLLSGGEVDDRGVSHYLEHRHVREGIVSDSLESLIAAGESDRIEFKPAIWFDSHQAKHNKGYVVKKGASKVRDKIIRTVAGFLNSEGGVLLIGVSDWGSSYGIEKDIEATSRGDVDGYELELVALLAQTLEKQVVARKVSVSFPEFQGKAICRVDVSKSDSPVFANTSEAQEEFFVRMGNSTHRMSVQTAMSYVAKHDWGKEE
jgi:hypothetical protein